MPYRPFELSGEQRHEITWYQGSPEATLQLKGPKEDPTTIRGWWKDRFVQPVAALAVSQADELLGGVSPVTEVTRAGQQGAAPILVDGLRPVSVRAFAEDVIDDMRQKGQEVEVTFLNHTRRGILHKFVQKWHTSADLEWEITFVWKDKGQSVSDLALQVRDEDLSTAIDKLYDEIENLEVDGSAGIELATGEAAFALGQVNEFIDEIEDSTFALESAFLSAVSTVTGPVATTQRTMGVFNFLKKRSLELQTLFVNEIDALTLNEEEDFSERLAARKNNRNRRRAAGSIAAVAAIKEDQLKKQLAPELIETFVAREDTDFREVAAKYYDSPDDWRALMRFNNATTSRLSAGQQVFVPRNLPSGDTC